MNKKILAVMFALILISGCGKFKDNLVDPTTENAMGNWSNLLQIYNDEISTRVGSSTVGGTPFLTTTDNSIIDFNWGDNPAVGTRCIKYAWTGEKETEYESSEKKDYCGFSFTIGKDFDNNEAIDVSNGAYNTFSFKARGELGENTFVKIEGPKSKNDDTVLDFINLRNTGIKN